MHPASSTVPRLRSLDHRRFLENQRDVLVRIAMHFGLKLTSQDSETLLRSGLVGVTPKIMIGPTRLNIIIVIMSD